VASAFRSSASFAGRHGGKNTGNHTGRTVAALLAPMMMATMVVQIPAAAVAAAEKAAADKAAATPKDVKGVKVKPVTITSRPEWTADDRELTEADLPPDVDLPAGVQTVDLTGGASASGAKAAKAKAATGRGVKAGSLPIWVAQRPTAASTAESARSLASPAHKVRVEVVGRTSSAAAGVKGLTVKVSRADGVPQAGQADVTVDYRPLEGLFGGDAIGRLRLVRLSDGQPISSVDNAKAGTLSATVPLAAGGAATGFAVVAAAEGENGDYKATSLTPASMWQVSQQTGSFSWSHAIQMPAPPGGVAPELPLSYSSASIDGRTSGNNTQGSWAGDGWDVGPGFIERSYRGCTDDRDEKEKKDPNNKGVLGGDLCYFADNAAMSFNGNATELVKVAGTDAGGNDKYIEYRGVSDDGSKIELIKDGRANGDVDGAYWRLTSLDGTQYYFGKNTGEGGSSATTKTESVWTTPVYSNHSDEPGYDKEFAKSRVERAWRWNLDYSVDPSGNTTTYFYGKEAGAYAREGDEDKRTTYDRGGYLKRVEYGSREDAASSIRPADRVIFETADRCIGACVKDGKPIAKRFPDTPWELYCDKAPCKTQFSPTFWTQKRLAKITTQVYAGSGDAYTDVDSWKLAHTYLQAGDNESTPMWLKSVTHTGHPTSAGGPAVTDPAVVFNPNADIMPNRVDTPNGHSSLFRSRVDTVTTESGAQYGITYSKPECTGSNLPKPWSNTKRCFPQYYGAEGEKPTLDWFHKYVVTGVDVYDNTGGFEHQQTNYDYLDTPAWGYDDSTLVKPKKRTWGQFRGYGRVAVRQGVESGVQSKTEYRYFRGMDGDKQPKTDELPPTGTPRNVQVEDSLGGKVDDHPAFAGQLREEIVYDGTDWISGTLNTPAYQGPTATAGPLRAWKTNVETTRTRKKLSDGKTRWSRTVTKVNGDNLPIEVDDLGDEGSANDDRCVRTEYAVNSSGMKDRVKRVETVGVNCAAKVERPRDVVRDVRTYYDVAAPFGQAPVRGLPVLVEELDRWEGATPKYTPVSTTGYDAAGRVTSRSDGLKRITTTKYKPLLSGPVTETTVTNPAKQSVTTTLDPALEMPVKIVDANGAVTQNTYDGAGRLLAVWAPGRDKDDYPDDPTVGYSYKLRKDGPSSVVAETLMPSGSKTYRTAVTLYDGLLRTRQTQTQTIAGGRAITDTVHDSRGLVDWTSSPYYDLDNTAPNTTLVTARARPEIPALTQNLYDGAGRIKSATFVVNGDAKWSQSTAYAGEKTNVSPPSGGIATTTMVDARDRKTELRQYKDPARVGADDAASFERITYSYTDRDQLASIVAPGGNAWTYAYDLHGNKIETGDPDNGAASMGYDEAGQVSWTKDARGKVLAYTYDDLGRKTSTRRTSKDGPKLAEWEYDTLTNGKGSLTKSVRYEPAGSANAYVNAVTGYDTAGRPTGNTVTVPASDSGLCVSGALEPCAYTQTVTYRPNGALSQVTLPAVAGLPKETLTNVYNTVGLANGLLGNQIYAQSVTYNQLDQLIGQDLGEHGSRVGLTYGYDDATGRLMTFNAVPELKSDIYNLTYSYNDAGSVTAISDSPDAGQPAETQCFGYDHLRRLTEAWTPASRACVAAPSASALGGPAPFWRSYTYDVSGNRKTEVVRATADTTRTYGYPNAGGGAGSKPHAVTNIANSGANSTNQQFSYDAAGNMICRPGVTTANVCAVDGAPGTGSQGLTWDDEGHLVKSTDTTGDTTYLYDADGNRLIRRDPTGATLYLPNGTEIRKPKTGAASGTRYYTHAGSPVAVRTTAGLTWLVQDHQGTSTAMVGTDKDLTVTRRRILPFGDTRGAAPTGWAGDKGFVGGTRDNTGLTHLGAREYDASIGRFISVDPLMDLADPQQWNGYGYSNDTPVTMSDPTGLLGSASCAPGEVGGPKACTGNENGPGIDPSKTGTGGTKSKGNGGRGSGGGGGGGGGGGSQPTPRPSPGPSPVAPAASAQNKDRCDGVCIGMAKGGRQNVRDSGLRDVGDDELKDLERKSKGTEKRRYQKELKARGLKHTGASDSRPRTHPKPPGGDQAEGDNDVAERVAIVGGAGVGAGVIAWWLFKLASPLCGPAVLVCAVVL
jgi:RHS repeat-associated protein